MGVALKLNAAGSGPVAEAMTDAAATGAALPHAGATEGMLGTVKVVLPPIGAEYGPEYGPDTAGAAVGFGRGGAVYGVGVVYGVGTGAAVYEAENAGLGVKGA